MRFPSSISQLEHPAHRRQPRLLLRSQAATFRTYHASQSWPLSSMMSSIQIVHSLQTISTMFHIPLSIVLLLYFLLAPRKFYELLRRVCRHELLLPCEVFEAGCHAPPNLSSNLACSCCCYRSAPCRVAASASGRQHGALLGQHAPPTVMLYVRLHLHHAELPAQLAGNQYLLLRQAAARAIRDCAL